jgi:hypothetical protein
MGVRATRAFVGAFGAGVSLAMASSVLLLIVSSVIAFKGWPDDLNGVSSPDVAELSKASPAATGASVADPVALPRPARSATAAKPAGAHRARPARAGRHSSVVASTDSQAPAVATSEPSPAPSAGTSLAARNDQGPVPQVGKVVRHTTATVGDAVAPVSPEVSGALESVGAAGADAVDQAGQAVDGLVGSVVKP